MPMIRNTCCVGAAQGSSTERTCSTLSMLMACSVSCREMVVGQLHSRTMRWRGERAAPSLFLKFASTRPEARASLSHLSRASSECISLLQHQERLLAIAENQKRSYTRRKIQFVVRFTQCHHLAPSPRTSRPQRACCRSGSYLYASSLSIMGEASDISQDSSRLDWQQCAGLRLTGWHPRGLRRIIRYYDPDNRLRRQQEIHHITGQ